MTEPERSFTMTRMLDAPVGIAFQAWTDPEHLQWFQHRDPGADRPIDVDLRVGGAWRVYMLIDENTQYWTGGIYREIVPNERLSFEFGAVDGWPRIDPDRPEDGLLATITFSEHGDRTEMTFVFTLPDHLTEDEVRAQLATGMLDGWNMTLDRLVAEFVAART